MSITDDEEYEKARKIGYEMAKNGSIAILDKLIDQQPYNSIFREGLEHGHFLFNEEQYIEHFGKEALLQRNRELGGDVDGYFSPHGISIENNLFEAFDKGYQMQGKDPEKLEHLLKSKTLNTQFIEALNDGKNQYEMHQKEKMQQYEREKIAEQQQRIKDKQQIKKRGR